MIGLTHEPLKFGLGLLIGNIVGMGTTRIYESIRSSSFCRHIRQCLF